MALRCFWGVVALRCLSGVGGPAVYLGSGGPAGDTWVEWWPCGVPGEWWPCGVLGSGGPAAVPGIRGRSAAALVGLALRGGETPAGSPLSESSSMMRCESSNTCHAPPQSQSSYDCDAPSQSKSRKTSATPHPKQELRPRPSSIPSGARLHWYTRREGSAGQSIAGRRCTQAPGSAARREQGGRVLTKVVDGLLRRDAREVEADPLGHAEVRLQGPTDLAPCAVAVLQPLHSPPPPEGTRPVNSKAQSTPKPSPS